MKKSFCIITLVIIVFSFNSCFAHSEGQKREYGILISAVTFSSDKIIGEYGDRIPDNLTAEQFMQIIKDKIPEDYYDTLKKYRLKIIPKDTYYLILIFDSSNNKLILFDYSCTSQVDGPILNEPYKYDVDNLELYDKCKKVD